MSANSPIAEARGSIWHRWEPHIHTPQTVLNDQFRDPDPWNAFLTKLESSVPSIRTLGVTDYLSIDRYVDVVDHWKTGRIANAALIFPNVEMRFGIETRKGSPINLHLLFSPEDTEHVSEIKRFLKKLEFRYGNECFCCCHEDLVRLGKAHDASATDENVALAIGTNQFKVGFEQLQEAWDKSEWARRNCLVAVAGGEGDGTSGLRDSTDSFAALRKSIEAFAHIIFTSNSKQRDFWLGRGAASLGELNSKWNGVKPCLHGCDAHQEATVGVPHEERNCWIKGDLTFESLRQACIEPAGRVHIGPQSPRGALPGQTMDRIEVSQASWMNPEDVLLNPGLIAIIGARGSGKTALADLIAAGGMAAGESLSPMSFLTRAREHLQESRADLHWENGEVTGTALGDTGTDGEPDYSAVQYLSQQFVDELCSAEGLADSLVAEIERVIFNAHPEDERQGATSFSELSAIRSAAAIERRARNEKELEGASKALAEERITKQGLDGLKKQQADLANIIKQDKKDRDSLVSKDDAVRAKRHEEVSSALEQRKRELVTAQARLRALKALKDDVLEFRTRKSSNLLAELIEQRSDAGLEESEWALFRLGYVGDVDSLLTKQIAKAEQLCLRIAGNVRGGASTEDPTDPLVPLIPVDASLKAEAVGSLQAEVNRLSKLIGTDTQNRKRFAALGEKLAKSHSTTEKLAKQIEHAACADDRITLLLQRRGNAYKEVFCSVIELEEELSQLYAPLASSLTGSTGALGRLSFSVKREVDAEAWANSGEALLDLRKNGPFKGRGELLNAVRKSLLPRWETGSSEEVSASMSAFIKENEAALRAHRPEDSEIRAWTSAVAKWLHGTDHIKVSYGLCYDGVDVERLSPGTRGIVLLLLYLAIDQEDDRPLIIDQPEENLDPQSVYDELVDRFREARCRRQIIIVTHNANLVVNTDVDQVIVASAQPHERGQLPQISYQCGGLENPEIRRRVCEILEGGEAAFKDRAKRLRVKI